MDKGLYDDVDEICEAVHYRLSRKVLPRITEDGYVEYGLQIPHNYQTRAASISLVQQNSKKTEFGPDVEWILRGSGSVSRGSAGSVHQSLGVNGASGELYGSNASLMSRNTDSSGSKNGSGGKRVLERSESFSSAGSSSDNWSRKPPIPQIRQPGDSARGKSVSPPSSTHKGQSQRRRRSLSQNSFRNSENVINEDELEEDIGKGKLKLSQQSLFN